MTIPSVGQRRQLLRAECGDCLGLCCVALGFARSADFAFDKPAGDPCENLAEDYRCGIHPVLLQSGFRGCTVFDCQGAGQRVTQRSFGGMSWRDDPATREAMFAVFPRMRDLHELLWLIDSALQVATADRRGPLSELWSRIDTLADAAPADILLIDLDPLRAEVGGELAIVSELTRAGVVRGPIPSALGLRLKPGADLVCAGLAGLDLRGISLRGAYLIAADLRGADLTLVDLLGADLRDADLSGANLERSLFLTRSQVQAAQGDHATRLPPHLGRPSHWG